MLTAPEAMPRGADQRCLQSSIDRAQARADESALRLEGGGDVAHAAFFTTIALADNGTTPADLGPKDRPLHFTRYATPHWWTPAHRLTGSPPLTAGALGVCTWPGSWLLHLALLPQAAALLDMMQPLQQLARVAGYQAHLAVCRRQKRPCGQAKVVSRRLRKACRCPCTHHMC